MVPRYLPEAGRENANVAFWRMLQAFSEAHESSAQEGQTEAPDRDKKIDLHFVAFIEHGGKLYEMGK
ncbi:hypothetical protein NP493_1159g00003 [Ridgeia piscesae]|uniref:ubiquitinyl hydrolase 1 n=1 Tax=Ridgeia piscesae TaxID=27915 RepID=A0AAD9KG90_RIDPI|nr:hypothetical protein NP493_1159g00003 [Ridgeia piscesae]